MNSEQQKRIADALANENAVLKHKFRQQSHPRRADVIQHPHDEPNCDLCALSARLSALEEVAEAIERIAEQQPKTLATLRHHGIVFDGPLGNDPKNWQHVAFSIYTDLCEVDTIARAALAGLGADTQESGV